MRVRLGVGVLVLIACSDHKEPKPPKPAPPTEGAARADATQEPCLIPFQAGVV